MTVEIKQRPLGWSALKLALGAMLVLGMVAMALDPEARPSENNPLSVVARYVVLGSGLLLMASNLWLILRRPMVLRATAEGVWFGAGPMIPWQDVALVYEAGMYFNRYGHSGRTAAIAVAFHRPRTMFRLPPFLWLTTLPFGNVRVSANDIDLHPNVLVAQLESLRAGAGAS